jgi:hypothetical protein
LLQFTQLELPGNIYSAQGLSYPAYVKYNRKNMVEQRRIEELEVAGARTGTLCLILSLKDITFLALQSKGLLRNY